MIYLVLRIDPYLSGPALDALMNYLIGPMESMGDLSTGEGIVYPFYYGSLPGDKQIVIIAIKDASRISRELRFSRFLGVELEIRDTLPELKDVNWIYGPDKPLIEWSQDLIIKLLKKIPTEAYEEIDLEKAKRELLSLDLNAKLDYLTQRPKILETLMDPKKWKVRVEDLLRFLEEIFDFVRVMPENPSEEATVLVRDGNTVYDVDIVIDPVVGILIKQGLASKRIKDELRQAIYSATYSVTWRDIDPVGYLNLRSGVLDLKTLKLLDDSPYLFRHRLKIDITQEELDEIRNEHYDIKENAIYRLWRSHFEDEDWDFFIDAIGTWLAPHRFRLIAFLIGPPGSGKSTLLAVLTRPIESIVARASLSNLDYTFALEGLIGKQINVYSEKLAPAIKTINVLNILVGENDLIEVFRKGKPPVYITSLKSMIFSMNDPPIVYEYGGETFAAFLDRLSIINMRPPEGFKPQKDLADKIDPKEAFKFLLWCRVQLENHGWEVRRRGKEELLEYLAMSSNTALQFSNECVEPVDYGYELGKRLYEAYVKWCLRKGITPMKITAFYTALATKYMKASREKQVSFLRVKLRKECET